ncbi:Hypothetical Protein FCC1311_118022, partial [Hondaea fermentalgiana]
WSRAQKVVKPDSKGPGKLAQLRDKSYRTLCREIRTKLASIYQPLGQKRSTVNWPVRFELVKNDGGRIAVKIFSNFKLKDTFLIDEAELQRGGDKPQNGYPENEASTYESHLWVPLDTVEQRLALLQLIAGVFVFSQLPVICQTGLIAFLSGGDFDAVGDDWSFPNLGRELPDIASTYMNAKENQAPDVQQYLHARLAAAEYLYEAAHGDKDKAIALKANADGLLRDFYKDVPLDDFGEAATARRGSSYSLAYSQVSFFYKSSFVKTGSAGYEYNQ